MQGSCSSLRKTAISLIPTTKMKTQQLSEPFGKWRQYHLGIRLDYLLANLQMSILSVVPNQQAALQAA